MISTLALLSSLSAAPLPPPAAPTSIHDRGKEAIAEAIRENHRRIREAHSQHGLQPRLSYAGGDEGQTAQVDFDVNHYDIDIAIDPENHAEYINGRVDITVESTVSALDEVVLDLVGLEVSAVLRLEHGNQDFEQIGDELVIEIFPALGLGEQMGLRVNYAGSPVPNDWDDFDIDLSRPTPVVWTNCEPEGSRTWWPCKDRPDDKATVDINITMANEYVVASNGTLQGIEDNGDGTSTTSWSTGYLLPPYLVAITATDFMLFEDSYELREGGTLPLTFYTYPEHEAVAREDVSGLPDMLAIFEQDWLPYPFAEEKYGHMEYPWGGAMEHSTLTSYGSGLYRGDHYFDWIVAHELAHQWWGDMVTCGTWDDIWLNEGFATYGEALWTEGLFGEQAYLDYMMTLWSSSFPGPIYSPSELFNSTVYDKGAWILHMLRGIVGRETLMEIMRTWGTDYAHMSPVTADWIATASDVAGQDLNWFFAPWLYEAGRPRYEYALRLEPLPGDSTLVELEVTQTQNGHMPYRMPITLRLETNGGGSIDTVIMNETETAAYSLRIAGEIVDLEPDPENYILANFREVPWTGIEGDAPNAPGSFVRLGIPAPNPFNPHTQIPVELTEAGSVSLRIHDLRGQLIRTLHEGFLAAGTTRLAWDGLNQDGQAVSSGVYFVRLDAAAATQTRKLVLLK